jgi:hypothetical protein
MAMKAEHAQDAIEFAEPLLEKKSQTIGVEADAGLFS